MADTKIEDLVEDTTPADTDIFVVVKDPSGSPANKNVSRATNQAYTEDLQNKTMLVSDSATNTVSRATSVKHSTDGVPAAGIGAGFGFIVQTAAGNHESGGFIDVIATDVSPGAENFDIVFKLMTAGATAAEVARLTSGGQFITSNGTAALPAIAGTGDQDSGLYFDVATIYVAIAGSAAFLFDASTFKSNNAAGGGILQGASSLTVPSLLPRGGTTTIGVGSDGTDVALITGGSRFIVGSDKAELRNGTTMQAIYGYHSYTDASNYSRFFMRADTFEVQFGVDRAGSGAARELNIKGLFGSILFGNASSEATSINPDNAAPISFHGKSGGFGAAAARFGSSRVEIYSEAASSDLHAGTVTNYQRGCIVPVKQSITAASGATVVATNIIPAGAFLLGVSTRVSTGLGVTNGTTGYTVGDGSDADLWGSVTGTAAGTKTTAADYTAAGAAGVLYTSAQSITLTATGGNFDGTGVIEVTAFYFLTEGA